MRYSEAMLGVFAGEWLALSARDQAIVHADFVELLRDEYDVPDDTNAAEVDNVSDASAEYRRRIGNGNLASYAATLAVARHD